MRQCMVIIEMPEPVFWHKISLIFFSRSIANHARVHRPLARSFAWHAHLLQVFSFRRCYYSGLMSKYIHLRPFDRLNFDDWFKEPKIKCTRFGCVFFHDFWSARARRLFIRRRPFIFLSEHNYVFDEIYNFIAHVSVANEYANLVAGPPSNYYLLNGSQWTGLCSEKSRLASH